MSNTLNYNDISNNLHKSSETLDSFAKMFFHNLSSIFQKSLSYYQILVNALFIFIVIIITYIIYLDIINRESNKKTRCIEVTNIYKENSEKTRPYFYNIYIVKDVFKSSFLSDFSICISYDFINEKTNIIFGKKHNARILTTAYSQLSIKKKIDPKINAFAYFDLRKLEYDYIEYNDIEDGNLYIDKNIITRTNYLFIITSDDNKILKSNEAKQLVKFAKDYGYDITKSVSPIYNILYAIDNHKNKDVI
jgi:hypothetical protein